MKNLFTYVAFLLFVTLSSYGNNIQLDNNIVFEYEISIETDLKSDVEEEVNSFSQTPRTIFQQISYCAQVQLDVKETYTPIFGPDRANSIALGAFLGCMGYLQ